ncbi:hypothetical protein ACIU1J_27655 [Azospirillum doebereinerae]|uniref:hypothetical protein n=1 Tax=Azospirillum doebereinerae TaxID=92933 RepID=UPI00384F5925
MAKLWTDKTTFGAGELSPTMSRRSDTQQHADGVKRGRNVRLLNAGGFTRRPGSLHMLLVPARSRLVEFTFSIDQLYLLVLSAGRMDAYLTDGTPAGALAGCPWTADDVQALTWVQAGDTVILACRSWRPQVIQRTGAASWSRVNWTADEGPGGALLQPYYKWVDPTVTLQPSGYAGTVTLTASSPAFDTPHVGQRLRYVGCEIQITAVASGTSATGTVLQTLPPSQRLTLEHVVGFRVGQVATGRETGAKGEIVAVDGTASTIDVVITNGETPFTSGEEIDSPTGAAEVTGVAEIGPQPTKQWDEPYLSPIYGYPAAVGLHRARLWLGGHTRLPAAVLASRIGAYYNMDLGTGEDAEAIFEDLGDGAVASIKAFVSAENLLIVTDQGPYYVPETAANPIRPSSIQFHRIGADPGGGVRPVALDEGVLYPHRSGAGMMDIRPTGDNTKSWKADDVALLASHLVRQPTDLAATHGADGAPERYAFAVNADGTMAVMHSIQSQQVLGWTLWETEGFYRSVAVLGGHVFAIVSRVFGVTTHWCLERFDQALCLDGAAVLPTGTGSAPLPQRPHRPRALGHLLPRHRGDAGGRCRPPTSTSAGRRWSWGASSARRSKPSRPNPSSPTAGPPRG